MGKFLTEKDIANISDETMKALKKQPKVSIMIDKSIGPYWVGGINGHMFKLKTGVMVEVPRDLATLISQNTAVMAQSAERVKDFTSPTGKDVSQKNI